MKETKGRMGRAGKVAQGAQGAHCGTDSALENSPGFSFKLFILPKTRRCLRLLPHQGIAHGEGWVVQAGQGNPCVAVGATSNQALMVKKINIGSWKQAC